MGLTQTPCARGGVAICVHDGPARPGARAERRRHAGSVDAGLPGYQRQTALTGKRVCERQLEDSDP